MLLFSSVSKAGVVLMLNSLKSIIIMKFYLKLILILFTLSQLSACTVISIADTVASTAIGAVKAGVKGTAAVIGAVIPDGDDEVDE